ncbi:MAG: NAD(P)/FAD-dependent oxidoreductase [Pseudomonadota bacterium]
MTTKHDAIIIGAGHNGLVCANYLARAGLKVLVLERRHIVGGAAVTEEIAPGFRASIFSYLMSILHPRIQTDLNLRAHGLTVMPCSDMLSPLGDDYIIFSDDVRRTQTSFSRFNKADADIYPEFDRALADTTEVFRKLLWETPFDPTKRDWKTFKQAAGFALRNRKYGRKFFDVAKLVTMSAYDFLSEWFEDDRIKAVLAYYASIGTFAGPRSPGSAYVILHHIIGENAGAGGWGFIRGGMGAISESLASAARANGVEILTDAGIKRIETPMGRVGCVVTTDGQTFSAPVVASNANAKILFFDLVGADNLPEEFVRDLNGYRTMSTAFKMNIAAERPPQYACLPRANRDRALGNWNYPTYVHVAPDIDYLERAYDDAKYGGYSRNPFITPVVPTIVDDTLAPAGKHVVNLFGGHAPYKLRDREWSCERDNFQKTVLDTMDAFAPGFSDDIIEAQMLLPEDIERIVNLPQGHIFQGELSTDQLFNFRPVPHWADYRTPIGGLYLCGASVHPGGGVSGIPGYNAAREILRDLGKKSNMRFAS